LLAKPSGILSKATSRISTPWTSPRTVATLLLVVVISLFACGILRLANRLCSSASRMVSQLLPFHQMDDLLLLDLSIEASASGTRQQATSSSVSKALTDTGTVYTQLRSHQQVASWSVEVWTRLSKCGNWRRREASFLRLRRMAESALGHLKDTRLVPSIYSEPRLILTLR
jgi:hypothetical protein